MKKVTMLLLIFTMIFTLTGQAFAGVVNDINHNTFTLENGQEFTEQELIKLLENYDGEIFKVSDNMKNENMSNQSNTIETYGFALYPAWMLGKWVIPIIGTVVIIPTGIYLGEQLVKAGSSLHNTIVKELDDIHFAKNNPTGRRVKDVEKRLKKEGWKKQKRSSSSRHDKWKKGGKTIPVPNHGSNTELKIGTLQSIWTLAGWR